MAKTTPVVEAPPSGVTFVSVQREIQETLAKQYEAVITSLPKAKREVALDGFRDGMRTMIRTLVHMNIIKLTDDVQLAADQKAGE